MIARPKLRGQPAQGGESTPPGVDAAHIASYCTAMDGTASQNGHPPRDRNATNQSVFRALSVLWLFAEHGPTLRVAEVANLCDLGSSTASRLLGTLVGAKLLERDAAGAYQLGAAAITLAGVALNRSELYRAARTIASEISCETGLGVNVAELRDDRVFYLLHFDGRLAPRSHTLMGRHSPLHATGLGKCLLAHLPDEQRANLLTASPLRRYTPHTICDPAELERELVRIRERGYATEVEELAFSRGCIAAPILGWSGAAPAAISISGPLSALAIEETEAAMARSVIEAGDRISTALRASRSEPTNVKVTL